jgi:hypothetical protein
VGDEYNNRVLIWNSFPATNAQAADNVLGQLNMTSYAPACGPGAMNKPKGIYFDELGMWVVEQDNHRVSFYH